MFDLTTIGEGQIRLTVPHGERLSRTRQVRMTAACSEANVAGLLAQLGRPTSWCSKLPQGDLAERCLSEFRSVGVDLTSMIRTDTGRMALYFMEPGEPPMPSRVWYDRLDTPFRSIALDEINWASMLDTRLVFVTGITAALSTETAAAVTHLVNEAADRDIRVALDVNYRSMLWAPEQARAVLSPLADKADIIFCSRRDAATVFGISGEQAECSRAIRERFGADHVVSTDQIDGVYYSGTAGEHVFAVRIVPVVDRPGAGDSFVAGTIHGYLNDDILAGINYGQRVATFALTHHGDLTLISPHELEIPTTSDIVR